MEISVKIESTSSDAKVSIDSLTVAGDVIEMLGRSPQMQQRFVYWFTFTRCLVMQTDTFGCNLVYV